MDLFKSVDFEEIEFECPRCRSVVLATVPNDIASKVSCKGCGVTIEVDLSACEPMELPN